MPKPSGVTRADLDRWFAKAMGRAMADPAFGAALVSSASRDVLDTFCAGCWVKEQLAAAGCTGVQSKAILGVVQETLCCGTDVWALMQAAVDQYKLGHWPLTADELAAIAQTPNYRVNAPVGNGGGSHG